MKRADGLHIAADVLLLVALGVSVWASRVEDRDRAAERELSDTAGPAVGPCAPCMKARLARAAREAEAREAAAAQEGQEGAADEQPAGESAE